MTSKDYFIDYDNKKLKAYSVHGFLAGVAELYELNYMIHDPYKTATQVRNIFQVSFIESEEGRKIAELEQQREAEAKKENRETELQTLISLLADDNLETEAKKPFPEFKEFAEQFKVTDRGATGLKKKLKEVRDNLLKELEEI